MNVDDVSHLSGHGSASFHLFRISLRRLFWSRQTLISLILLGFATVAVVAWSVRHDRSPQDFIEQIFLTIYISFLLPIFCLSFATAGISSEVEDRSLVYLLITPLPRPLIFAAKAAASLVLSLAWTMGSLTLLCYLAEQSGREAFRVLWLGVLWSTVAYVSLFQLFSVSVRRATMLALAYALFLETFIGNMPGTVKRLAISYYTRCVIFDASSEFGIGASGPYNADLFLPITGPTAQVVLYLLSAALFLTSMWIFTYREYAK